jgi:integrase
MSIKERGNSTWLVRIYLGRDKLTGKRQEYNETIHGSYEEALTREEELKEMAASGQLLARPQMTVEELFERHCRSVRNEVSPGTIHNIRDRFNRYVKTLIGQMGVGDVTTEHIKMIIDGMLDRKLAPNTVRGVYIAIQMVFSRAVKNKLLSVTPLKDIKIPKARMDEATYLTYEETSRFDAIKTLFWYGFAFILQIHTGLRNQELMALRWEDINLEDATLHVRRACVWLSSVFKMYGPTKTTKSDRYIPLEPEQIKLLRTHQARQKAWIEKRRRKGLSYYDEGLIFATRDGRTPCMSVIRRTFKAMLCEAKIYRAVRWYDLRHTYATYMIDMGHNLIYLAKLMGTSVKMLEETYVHIIFKRQREAAIGFVKRVPISTNENEE